MGTRDAQYLAIDIGIFPDEVGKKTFLSLHLGGYRFGVAHDNRYLPRSSKENVLSTFAGNVSIWDFVMIH